MQSQRKSKQLSNCSHDQRCKFHRSLWRHSDNSLPVKRRQRFEERCLQSPATNLCRNMENLNRLRWWCVEAGSRSWLKEQCPSFQFQRFFCSDTNWCRAEFLSKFLELKSSKSFKNSKASEAFYHSQFCFHFRWRWSLLVDFRLKVARSFAFCF